MLCPHCDYNVVGCESEICPECGQPYDRARLTAWAAACDSKALPCPDLDGRNLGLAVWGMTFFQPTRLGRLFSPSPSLERAFWFGMAMRGLSILPASIAALAVSDGKAAPGMLIAAPGIVGGSLACEYIPPRRLGEGVGYLGLGFILATAIGPSLGLSLAESYGYRASFGASAVLFGVATLLMLLIPHRRQLRVQEASTEHARIRLGDLFASELLIYAALAGIISLSNGVVNTFLNEPVIGPDYNDTGVDDATAPQPVLGEPRFPTPPIPETGFGPVVVNPSPETRAREDDESYGTGSSGLASLFSNLLGGGS